MRRGDGEGLCVGSWSWRGRDDVVRERERKKERKKERKRERERSGDR